MPELPTRTLRPSAQAALHDHLESVRGVHFLEEGERKLLGGFLESGEYDEVAAELEDEPAEDVVVDLREAVSRATAAAG